MEQFLDFIFGIQWWQWLLAMSCLAGLYYVLAAYALPFLKGVQDEHAEQTERQRQEKEEQEKAEDRRKREADRKKHLKTIPSGPLEPANLPKAVVTVRNRNLAVSPDQETVFGTQRGVAVPIMARGVSRHHAKVRPEPRGYVLYDLVSETGTFVAGQRIDSKVLADGDHIRIGPVELVFRVIQKPDGR